jgi:hypothetical protein
VTAKTAKTRDNYMPRLVFYPKKRSLFTQKRFFTLQNEKCPPLITMVSGRAHIKMKINP